MNAQTKKQRIAQLLSSGLSAADVKLVVGVSEGYLKRLREDEEFNAMLRAYAAPDSEEAAQLEGATKSDKEAEAERLADRYTVLETKVVNQLIANTAMADTKELVSLLGALKKAQPQAAPSVNIGVAGNAQISLTLPTNALGADALQLSPTNEVIAVQGRSLIAMDTDGAQKLLEKERAQRVARKQPQPAQQGEVYHDL